MEFDNELNLVATEFRKRLNIFCVETCNINNEFNNEYNIILSKLEELIKDVRMDVDKILS
jgi:hypothetical protein